MKLYNIYYITKMEQKLIMSINVLLVVIVLCDQLLGVNRKYIEPLHLAIQNADLGTVESLLRNGADPNIKNYLGDTPLHLACWYDHLEIVKILLENGADPNIKNYKRETPLWIARRSDIVKFLLENGADPTIRYF